MDTKGYTNLRRKTNVQNTARSLQRAIDSGKIPTVNAGASRAPDSTRKFDGRRK